MYSARSFLVFMALSLLLPPHKKGGPEAALFV
jgi:hypothetical protein